jgi:hypothetical protein
LPARRVQEWVEVAAPAPTLLLEYLATSCISLALLLHCYFDSGSPMAWQHAGAWLLLQALAWSRYSPSCIAWALGARRCAAPCLRLSACMPRAWSSSWKHCRCLPSLLAAYAAASAAALARRLRALWPWPPSRRAAA